MALPSGVAVEANYCILSPTSSDDSHKLNGVRQTEPYCPGRLPGNRIVWVWTSNSFFHGGDVKRLAISIPLFGAALFLAACSAAQPALSTNASAMPAQSTGVMATTATVQASLSGHYAAQTDKQGAVTFAVTPLNLAAPGATLDFDISLNTHSVNLGWNLAAHSTLATDTGRQVQGTSWPIGNGHHYDGTLTFPARTADGANLMEGARRLTLTIRDTDVAERVFVWDISQ